MPPSAGRPCHSHSGGMSRFSFGDNPLSQALRACTISASAPAAITPRASASSADFRILVVDAEPAFDGDRNFHRALHRRDAPRDQIRLRHQAGAEAAILHPVGRAADIEIDLVVAKILADFAQPARDRAGPSRPAAAPPDARWHRNRAAAGGRHAGSRRSSASRYKAAHAASSDDGTPGNAGRSSPSSGQRRI